MQQGWCGLTMLHMGNCMKNLDKELQQKHVV